MGKKYIFDCSVCTSRCDGVSKLIYNFKNDVELSELVEQKLIKRFIENDYKCYKNDKTEYPDLKIISNGNPVYLEVKVGRRTFMKIEELLPLSELVPSETVVLNLSDLLRYIEFKKNKIIDKTYIIWVLYDRKCINDKDKIRMFFQDIDILENIYNKYLERRRFRRKSGIGDIVDGVHKGVVVNYHFSLNELIEFDFEKFKKIINN